MGKQTKNSGKDFRMDGIDIQTAMIHHVQAYPDRITRPKRIVWNGKSIWTSFDITVPKEGRFRLDFLSKPREPLQGVDVKAEAGEIILSGREKVQTLRT